MKLDNTLLQDFSGRGGCLQKTPTSSGTLDCEALEEAKAKSLSSLKAQHQPGAWNRSCPCLGTMSVYYVLFLSPNKHELI